LIPKIQKKVIFSSLFLFNLTQPFLYAELNKIKKNLYQQVTKAKKLDLSSAKKSSNFSNFLQSNNFEEFSYEKKFFKQYSQPLLSAINGKQKEIVIQSDKQSEINEILSAEGNVSVSHKGKLLKADNLIYDKLNKKFSAKGNIELILGDQILKASYLEYDFISEKGYLLDVRGSINTNTLMDDLSSNFSLSDYEKIESLLELKKKEVLYTPGRVDNWLFFTDKMTIEGEKLKSNKIIFTNDLLELKQVKLEINSLEVISEVEKLKFKSSLNYLIFEDKVSIPFWLGNRTLKNSEELFDYENRWSLGYDNLDKDGYFIGRKFNPIDISDDFVLDLEPQYLIQRSLKGYTKSFVKRGDSITSDKVKRNTSFEDYFGLKSEIKGKINNWDLQIEKNLNSLDFNKFTDAFRFKTYLTREIDFFDSKWNKSFYGVYRDRIWNGSLGEAEIYEGYGSKLEKNNTWFDNGIKKTEFLSIGLANIKAEALNTKNLDTNFKGNLFYSIDQKFPISIEVPKSKSIDISYSYIPEPISKGVSLDTRLEASYSFYENGDHQEYLGLGFGPELIFGNFKNKNFDYTRIKVFPFYKVKNGESAFKFDNNNENFTLNLSFDQQLFGPIILKSDGKLDLTSSSDDYGEFIDSKISLHWKKRSYDFGIFYQPHNQAGGISFSLFGFK